MTEDQVRAAVLEVSADMIVEWRREQRAAGLPLDAIEYAATILARECAANLERDLPTIMRNMAITACAASSH